MSRPKGKPNTIWISDSQWASFNPLVENLICQSHLYTFDFQWFISCSFQLWDAFTFSSNFPTKNELSASASEHKQSSDLWTSIIKCLWAFGMLWFEFLLSGENPSMQINDRNRREAFHRMTKINVFFYQSQPQSYLINYLDIKYKLRGAYHEGLFSCLFFVHF